MSLWVPEEMWVTRLLPGEQVSKFSLETAKVTFIHQSDSLWFDFMSN